MKFLLGLITGFLAGIGWAILDDYGKGASLTDELV